MGMNIPSNNYYSTALIYTDVFKTASGFVTYDVAGNVDGWNLQRADEIPVDSNGYPLELPVVTSDASLGVRMLVNNYYEGEYVLLYDGDGDISIHSISNEEVDGNIHLTFTGTGGNRWIQIYRSNPADPIRNIRMIPVEYLGREEEMPLFREPFLKGLRPFHALRFMDWMHTNDSKQKVWNDRVNATYISQGTGKGMAIEFAIELANQLKADAWFCVPHAADENYQRQMARMIRDRLDPRLKVYLEYSNEIWNWQFEQAHWVGKNGITNDTELNPADSITQGLAAIGQEYCDDPDSYCHPEKDAYMMGHTFKIWSSEFTGQSDRLIRVAAGQQGWYANFGRILRYLFEDDGVGADAVSGGGYFNFNSDLHEAWNAMNPADVTPEMILNSVDSLYPLEGADRVEGSSAYADQYDIDYLVYEGGQHMQPWKQGEYDYNQSVWDAQIHPAMYDMYMKNFQKHVDVGTDLFMAFSYVGARESRWGSWGHLESLDQLNAADLKSIAPKYQALLDANTPKDTSAWDDPTVIRPQRSFSFAEESILGVDQLHSFIIETNPQAYSLLDSRGKDVNWNVSAGNPAPGVYWLRVGTTSGIQNMRVIILEE